MIGYYRIAAAGVADLSVASGVAHRPWGATGLSRALRRLRELRRGPRRPAGGGGPAEEAPPTRSIMTDPNFWMLMIH